MVAGQPADAVQPDQRRLPQRAQPAARRDDQQAERAADREGKAGEQQGRHRLG